MQSPGCITEHFQKIILAYLNDRSRSRHVMQCCESRSYNQLLHRLNDHNCNLNYNTFKNHNNKSTTNLSTTLCFTQSEKSSKAEQVEEDAGGMESNSTNGSSIQSIFSYSNLVHAVSGAAGSVIAISVFYPLDTVRTRLQVDDHRDAKNPFQVCHDIFQEEGLNGLFRGWPSMAATMFVSSFVYFYTYTSLKFVCLVTQGDVGPVSTIARDLLVAFLAGIVNVLVTTPLWVANTRLKLQGAKLHTSHYTEGKSNKTQYNGIVDCILKIIRREGIRKLWGGTIPSLVLASNPAIQFMIYEALKRYFKKALNAKDLSALMYFLIGAIAKTVATVITYPLQVIQSRLRAGYAKHESTQTLKEIIMNMIRTRGFGSLYKGMEAKLLQTVLTSALMFLTYEKIAAFIFRLMGM